MDSPLFSVGLPIALAIIMFGLGLSLTMRDFGRVVRWPRAAVIALTCQIVGLPVLCFGLVLLYDFPPVFAVGMMLLAAAPGGSTANLFSYLAGGDVALNVTLTAINSLLATVTIPIVVNLSALYFAGTGSDLALPPGEMLTIVAMLLVPVALGMVVRNRAPDFAARMQRPVKFGSVVVLILVIVGAVAGAWDDFTDNVLGYGSMSLILCALALALGYWVPHALGVSRAQSIASCMEVGIQNGTLAVTIAVSLLHNAQMALAPAMYGLMMFIPAAATTAYLAHRSRSHAPTANVDVTDSPPTPTR